MFHLSIDAKTDLLFVFLLVVQINTVKYLMNASCGTAIGMHLELHDLCRSTDASYSISVNCLYSNKLLADSVLAASSTKVGIQMATVEII